MAMTSKKISNLQALRNIIKATEKTQIEANKNKVDLQKKENDLFEWLNTHKKEHKSNPIWRRRHTELLRIKEFIKDINEEIKDINKDLEEKKLRLPRKSRGRLLATNGSPPKKIYILTKKKEMDRLYKAKNKEKLKEQSKLYREKNKEKIRERDRLAYQKNKEKKINASKDWYQNNKDKKKEYDKKRNEKNKEQKKLYDKERYEKNKLKKIIIT